MITPIVVLALAALIVVLASAVEVAFFAIPAPRVDELASAGNRASSTLAALRAQPASLLSVFWGLRAAGAALAAVAGWRIAELVEPSSAVLRGIAVALAILIVVLAEFAGKTLGQHAGERLCLVSSIPVWLLSRLLLPLTWPAELISRALSPRFGEIMPGISDREIRDIASQGNGEPVIDEHERRLIEKAFLLDQTTAYDVMTPRVGIVAWPESQKLADVMFELRTARYSRIPLYSESIDHITGVLYTRDAYQALISGQRDVQLKALAREPVFVPGSITLDRLLLDFQTRRIHLGIVIDEYGGVDGLVALEDILEELVGEIEDESDVAEEPIIRLSRNVILVAGSADVREINHFLNTSFPLLEHRSLNGYLLDIFGQVPQPGEKIEKEGVLIEVTAASDTQVLRARLTRAAPRPEEPAGESGRPGPAADEEIAHHNEGSGS